MSDLIATPPLKAVVTPDMVEAGYQAFYRSEFVRRIIYREEVREMIEAALAVSPQLEALRDPPKHSYWRAGDLDCPAELKASNGEMHTLRCKVCSEESPHNPICFAAIAQT